VGGGLVYINNQKNPQLLAWGKGLSCWPRFFDALTSWSVGEDGHEGEDHGHDAGEGTESEKEQTSIEPIKQMC
jgi:hypothetical protein